MTDGLGGVGVADGQVAGTAAVALVPAAGRGERLGGGTPKALRLLAGEPLLVHAVRALLAAPSVGQVVIAAPPEELVAVRELLAGAVIGGESLVVANVVVVAGGPTRTASVGAALLAADPAFAIVLVHDAARPLTPSALVEAVVASVAAGADAVVPALPVTDTVKRIDAHGQVIATVDRSHLVAVQTPQGFRREVIERAYSQPGGARTDDAGMVEAMGLTVHTIAGHADAMKITHPADLLLAEAILSLRRQA